VQQDKKRAHKLLARLLMVKIVKPVFAEVKTHLGKKYPSDCFVFFQPRACQASG
jgi:hypothetical protein